MQHTTNNTGPDLHYLAQITLMVTANVLANMHMLAATNYFKVRRHDICAILQQINGKMTPTKPEYEQHLNSVHLFLTTKRKYIRKDLQTESTFFKH